MPQVKPDIETLAKIKVIGVGGSGGSAVDRMVKEGIRGVEFVAMNTDIQALHHNRAGCKIHIGKTITRGLGAGMNPEVGRKAAEESQKEIQEVVKDAHMVFITCGLGGGTGSGASPVIAKLAREAGALVVAVVTRPFSFEGAQRSSIAERAHRELSDNVDTIITIPNDRVLQIIDKKYTLLDSFKIIDDVLRQGVLGISELITVPGLINLDFNDVKTIMKDQGSALMGIGTASGESRAVIAAKAAISSPLLELAIDGAKGILLTISGSSNLGMQEIKEAADLIKNSADENVRLIFGVVINEDLKDDIRITVIATGFENGRRGEKRENEALKSPLRPPKNIYSSSSLNKRAVPENNNPFNFENIEKKEEKTFEYPAQTTTQDPVFSPRVLTSAPVEKKIEPEDTKKINPNDDSFLEIPTFIRKKMGLG